MIRICLLVLFIAAGLLVPAGDSYAAQTADQQLLKQQIQQILKEHPEIILDALQGSEVELYTIVNRGYGKKRRQDDRARWRAQLNNPLIPVIEKNRPLRGNPTAKITIVEYANFQCSACVTGSNTIKQLIAKYPGKIRLVFKHFASSPLAQKQATYFEAIARQNPAMAWAYHDQALKQRRQIAEKKEVLLEKMVTDLAKRYKGFDRNRLIRDMADEKIAAQINLDRAEAKRFRFSGTPTFVVNGISIHGAAPLPEFEEVLALLTTKDKTLSLNLPKNEDCDDCDGETTKSSK